MIDIITWFIKIFIWPTAVLLLLHLYISRKYGYWKKRGIWYKKPAPFFGNLKTVFTLKQPAGCAFQDIHLETKTPYIGIFIIDKPALLIKDTDLIKSVLIKDFNNFADRDFVSDLSEVDSLASQVLFLMKNPDWRFCRRKMTSAFTSGKIKSIYSLIADAGKCLVDFTANVIKENDVIECKELTTAYTTEVITSTVFGVKDNCIENENSEFRIAAREILDFNDIKKAFSITCYLIAPKIAKLFRLRFLDIKTSSFLRKAFWKIVNYREKTKNTRNDFVDILIQMRKEDEFFDGDKMLAQAVMFFVAGYETTGTTITFALYELAKHPEIQNKLRDELKNALKTNSDFDYDMISTDLKYLDMVFKETLRLYPSVPYINRECTKEYKIPGTDDVIDKGVSVYISTLGLHMDPNNFPDPEKFNPDRFSDENLDNTKPYSYLPFGEGPRNCLGERFGALSSKCAIANIVRHFKVEFCENTVKKIDFHPRAVVLAPRGMELPLRFKKID